MSERAFKMTCPAGEATLFLPGSAARLVGTRTVVAWKGSRVGASITGAEVVDGGRAIQLTIDPDEPVAPLASAARRGTFGDDPCARKIRFESREGALGELARIIKRAMDGERRRSHIETGCYECPECGGWHLSSKPWDGNIANERRTT